MDIDHETEKPWVLVGKGELNAKDRRLVTFFLRRLGLVTQFMTPDAYEKLFDRRVVVVEEDEVKKQSYELSFTDIASPSDFLIREHFLDFGIHLHPELSRGTAARVFLSFVDGKGHGWDTFEYVGVGADRHREYREPRPMDGIILKTRDGLGLPPYDGRIAQYYSNRGQLCAGFAIQAGSIVQAVRPLESELNLSPRQRAMVLISSQLQVQFETST